MLLFKRYLVILIICTLSSAIPWLHYGLIFGFPSVLIASIALTIVFRKQLDK